MSSASFVQADLADATGKVWTRELAFNAEWDLSDISLGSHAEVNHPVLVITLEAPADVTPAASRFYIAITANDGLVRALNPQRLIADNLISDQHPELIIDRGNISDDDSAHSLPPWSTLPNPVPKMTAAQRGWLATSKTWPVAPICGWPKALLWF